MKLLQNQIVLVPLDHCDCVIPVGKHDLDDKAGKRRLDQSDTCSNFLPLLRLPRSIFDQNAGSEIIINYPNYPLCV